MVFSADYVLPCCKGLSWLEPIMRHRVCRSESSGCCSLSYTGVRGFRWAIENVSITSALLAVRVAGRVAHRICAFWVGNCQKLELTPFDTCCPTSRQSIANPVPTVHQFGCIYDSLCQIMNHFAANHICLHQITYCF